MTHKCNKKYNMHDLPIIGYKHGHCVRYARKITPIYDTLRSGMETIYIYQFQKKNYGRCRTFNERIPIIFRLLIFCMTYNAV